jgi:hypothetical protein
MTTNAIHNPAFEVNQAKTKERTSERCAPLTLKQQFGRLLREMFEGYEEYLGATPD